MLLLTRGLFSKHVSLSCRPHSNSPTLPIKFGMMTVIFKSTTEALGSLTKKLFTL